MEENKKMEKKSLAYVPLIITVIYIVFTLVIFKFGVISWDKVSVNKALFYVVLVYIFFSLGYILYIRYFYKSDREKMINKNRCIFIEKVSIWLFRIGAAMIIVYSCAWLIQNFGTELLKFIKAPGAAYDKSHFLDEIYNSGVEIEFPMWFRWISRFNTMLSGISIAAVCIGTYHFRRLKFFDKILYVTMVVMYIFRAWMLGKQSSFLIIILEIIISIGASYISELYDELEVESLKVALKKKWKILFVYTVSIVCMFLAFGGLIVFMQNDRAKQREIRRLLYLEAYADGSVSKEELEYFVVKSIEIRTGYSFKKSPVYDIIEEKYGEFIEKSATYNSNGINNNVLEEDFETELEDNFTGIDRFYSTKKDEMLRKMSKSLYYGIQAIEMYLTNGYASMALAFDLDFKWSYFVGNSIYLSSLAENMTGLDIIERTYPAQNEEVNEWSSTTYSNTLYTWLASDLTFPGVVILFFFYGMLFAKSWMDVISLKNVLAIPVCYLIAYSLIFSTQNNMLFNTMGAIIMTFVIALIYVGGNIVSEFTVKVTGEM